MSLFLNKQVGISISDHAIEVAEVKKSKGGFKVLNLNRVILADGVVENGAIKDSKKLQDTLEKALRTAAPNSIATSQIIFGLPTGITYSLFDLIRFEDIKNSSLKESVKKKVFESIPVDSNKIIYDHQVIYNDKDSSRVLTVAVHKKELEEWHQFFTNFKIKVKVFVFEPLAIGKVLLSDPPKVPVCILGLYNHLFYIDIFNTEGLVYSYSAKQTDIKIIKQELSKSFDFFKEHYSQEVVEIIVAGEKATKAISETLQTHIKIRSRLNNIKKSRAIGLATHGFLGEWLKGPVLSPNQLVQSMVQPTETGLIKEGQLKETKSLESKSSKDNNASNNKKIILLIILLLGVLAIIATYLYKNKTQDDARYDIQIMLDDTLIDTSIINKPDDDDIKQMEGQATTTEMITIEATGFGWLRVRSGPGTDFDEIVRVDVGKSFPLLEKVDNWYKIEIDDETVGWVFGQYVTKQ